MKRMKLGKVMLLMGCGLLATAAALRADSLDVSFPDAIQAVVQGTTEVDFYATVSNPSATDMIYLNGDSPVTYSPLISIDATPYNNNAPLFLIPGASNGEFEIFDVTLPADLATGTYTGLFSITGGADGGTGMASDDLADLNFTIDVTAPVTSAPEPASLLLLGAGLLSLGLLRKRLSLSR